MRPLLACLIALSACAEQTTSVPRPNVATTEHAGHKAEGEGHAAGCCGGTCGGGATCNSPDDPARVQTQAPGGAALSLAGEKYGAGVTLTETVAIATILAQPDAWVGKRVRVEAEVSDVCRMRGCWMELKDADKKMRFKVVDGQITFPVSAIGKFAVAEGTVRKIPLDLEQTKKVMAHEAEEMGKPFDPATVTAPMTLVRIDGSGAVIRDKR